MPCKVWQGRPLRQKKRAEKEACAFAFCSGTDGAYVIHMHEAGGCQPITLTLAMELWPWTQWKRMGPVWAVVLRLYPGAGKSGWAAWLQYTKPWLSGGMPLCAPAPASKWWMEGRRQEKMSPRHLCFSGRCLGKELSETDGEEEITYCLFSERYA